MPVCVGGPLDHQIESEYTELRMFRCRAPLEVEKVELFTTGGCSHELESKIEIYHLENIAIGNRWFSFWRHESLSLELALVELFSFYAKGTN